MPKTAPQYHHVIKTPVTNLDDVANADMVHLQQSWSSVTSQENSLNIPTVDIRSLLSNPFRAVD